MRRKIHCHSDPLDNLSKVQTDRGERMKVITVEISDEVYHVLMRTLTESPRGHVAICVRRVISIGPVPELNEVTDGMIRGVDVLKERTIFDPKEEQSERTEEEYDPNEEGGS